MRSTALLLIGFLAASAAGAVGTDLEVRTIEHRFEITDGREVLLDLPLGVIYVESGQPGRVEIDIVIQCDSPSERCRARADEIYLDADERRGSLSLDIRGFSGKLRGRPSVEVHLRLPTKSAIAIDLGVGEVEITGIRGDVEVDLGVGEVTIFAAEEVVRSLRLAAGVGDVDLRPRRSGQSDSGFLFLGNELHWDEGPGDASFSVDVGVGEVNVTLE